MLSKFLIAWSLTELCVLVRAMGMTAALRAFEDVEDALAGDYYLRKREGALGDAVSSSADSVKFGRQQLEQGQIDMFTVLRLTGESLAAKVQLTQIRASRLRERVNLYLVLGGDFEGTGAQK
jgi:multidrug efflux system outer membrane protein